MYERWQEAEHSKAAPSIRRNELYNWWKDCDAALAEMERDREFFEAADTYCGYYCRNTVIWGAGCPEFVAMVAAYRKRREGMKHAE